MYSKAELFDMAAKQPKEVFLGNVTLSIPDDAEGNVDLDAETARLSHLWDVSRMSMREMVKASGRSQTAFAKGACIPYRTMQGWCLGERECPVYVRFLLAEHYGLI
jgi:hypothetical protein|nr:MAG TPA: putative DNA-binding protein [Caudoviricetes sp.]